MRSKMMPGIEKSPDHEQKDQGHKENDGCAFAEKKFSNQEQERAEKHQPAAKPMSRAPGRRAFQRPRCANADKIIRPQITEVVAHDRKKNKGAPDHRPPAGDRVT